MASETNKIESTSVSPGVVFADLVCERGILGLLLMILVVGPLALGAVKPIEFAIIEGLTILVLVLWGIRVWLNPRYRFFWPPICWAVLAVVVYEVVRSQFVEMPHMARQEMCQVIVYAALFFAVINNLNRRESATVVAVTLIILAVGLCCFGFYQVVTKNPNVWMFSKPEGYSGRASGTYINPNHFAGFLEIILPLGLAYALLGRFNHTTKALLAYGTLMIAGGIGLTLSRGGIISAGIALILLLTVLLFQRDYFLIAAVTLVSIFMVIGAALWFMPQAKIRFAHTELFQKGKTNDRVLYWKAAMELYKKEPAWGIGSGHFNQEFWPYRPITGGRISYVHNDYLQALCEWGTVGFGIILTAISILLVGVRMVWNVLSPNRRDMGKKHSTRTAFVLGGSFGLVAILIHSLVDFNMHIPANAILVVIIMGLLTSHLRFVSERFWVNPRVTWRIAFSLIALVCLIFVGFRTYKSARAGVYLEQAADNGATFENKAMLLKKAAQVEPDDFQTVLALGQLYRVESWKGRDGFRELAEEALTYYKQAMELSPYDPVSPLGYGMCLDWLGRTEEATPFFEKASQLDPNGYETINYLGWHYLQMEDYVAAKSAFERVMRRWYTPMGAYYIGYINAKLREASQKQK